MSTYILDILCASSACTGLGYQWNIGEPFIHVYYKYVWDHHHMFQCS